MRSSRPPAPVIACLALLAWPGFAAAGPVDDCRAAHAGDPAAHIECLEAALLGQSTEAAVVREGVPAGLGAEQVIATKRLQETPEELSVRIVSATYNARGLGTFRLEDGQLWRETGPAPARWRLKPETQYPARIVVSRLGGYRMHVEGVRWMKTVQRVE